jgi:hypothetical protein
MNNLFMFCLAIWLAGMMFGFMSEGKSAFATTSLTAAVTEDDTTINVHTAEPFLSTDFVTLGNEDICYADKTATTFTGLTRGCNDTSISAHPITTRVYSEAGGFINKALSFEISSAFSEGGIIGTAKGLFKSVKAIPDVLRLVAQVIQFDFGYLEGNGVYIKYLLLYPISAGLVFSLVRMALGR